MAVFERERSAKLTLDDSVPLYCFIETSKHVKDHIVKSFSIILRKIIHFFKTNQWYFYNRNMKFGFKEDHYPRKAGK